MGWAIHCTNSKCEQHSWAENIVELLEEHRDEAGWFLCSCGSPGYIEKSYELQEPGDVWEPYLRGAITLGKPGETYQPFVFLVSYEPDGPSTDIWFSYYKDLRKSGGRLKLGYGPGGPPVLGTSDFLELLSQLVAVGYIAKEDVSGAIRQPSSSS